MRISEPAELGELAVVEIAVLRWDKVSARELAKKAKVPTVPGSEGAIEDEKQALKIAHQIGYPVIIKAAAGGGGRGMRVAHNDVSLQAGLRQAAGRGRERVQGLARVYIEKYVEFGRHVEVQILADNHGNAVHLWERDCSLQRRHQKLVEESPSPVLDRKSSAKSCARPRSGWSRPPATPTPAPSSSSSTSDQNFYFLEVNARIQVEHPVTEMVTGIDLIKEQIRIAAGEPLCRSSRRTSQQTATRSSAASTPRTRPTTSPPRPA